MKNPFCCCFLLLTVLRLLAQSSPLEHIGIEQGLSQGFVTCLLQDREGFIWAGSQHGLNRFDGHRVEVFTHDPFDSLSLSTNFICGLLDVGDYLFIGTVGSGINLFHKKSQRFFRVPFIMAGKVPVSSKEEMLGNHYPAQQVGFDIIRDAHGDIWMKASNPSFNSEGWVVRMEVPEGFWEHLPDRPELLYQIKFHSWWMEQWPMHPFWPYYLSSNGDEVFSYQLNGLLSFDFQNNRWIPAQHPGGVPDIICNIAWAKNGTEKLLQTPDFDTYYCNKAGACAALGRLKGYVFALDSQLVWIKEQNMLNAYHFTESPFRIDNSITVTQVPINDGRTFIQFDKSGNLWFTEALTGLSKYSSIKGRFRHYFKGHSMMGRPFMTRSPDRGSGYISMADSFNFGDDPDPILEGLRKLILSENLKTFNICDDGKRHYWLVAFFTKNNISIPVLIKIDKKDGSISQIPVPDRVGTPFHAAFDDKGRLWFAIDGHLVSFDTSIPDAATDTGKWRFYEYKSRLNIAEAVTFLEKTADGSWWLATYDGLIRAKPNNNPTGFDFQIYRSEPYNRNSLRNSNIASLMADPKDANLLWIGTRGGGMSCLDIKHERFKTITTKEGLPDNVIYGILSDYNMKPANGDYNLWLSTNRGIVRYTPATGKIKNYRKADGLQEDEFNSNAFAYSDSYDKTGKLIFGGVNGLNVFDPNDLVDNPVKPSVYLTKLLINNTPVSVRDSASILTESIEFTKQITLSYSKNNISFEFAALEFTAPSKNRYRYWLEGAEKEGAHEGTEPYATYLNLPPGSYTFILNGSNNDGIWSEQPVRLKIRVLPPWYRHPLAYLFYLLLLAGMVVWYMRLRESKQKLAHRLEMEKQEHAQRLDTERREAGHQLEINRLKLEEFTLRLSEKSETIAALEQQLRVEEYGNGNFPDDGRDWEKLYTSHILTKADWEKFRELFEHVYPGFYAQLAIRYPALTPAETRMLSLVKMKLNKEKTASVLGISSDSVRKTKMRLRKKLALEDEELEEIIQNLSPKKPVANV